jgi:hypothetical protein
MINCKKKEGLELNCLEIMNGTIQALCIELSLYRPGQALRFSGG